MATRLDPVKIGLYGLVGFVFWKVAENGGFGEAGRAAIRDLKSSFSSGSGPAISGPSGSGSGPAILDMGGVPVIFDGGLLRQDPSVGGTNTYGAGDVFKYRGMLVQYEGGRRFRDASGRVFEAV